MTKKKSNFDKFLHKIRFQYRVSVMNENTLEESWHIRLSRLSVVLYASLFVILTFIILASLIIFTPLKYYLPGYESFGNRSAIISESITVDSLEYQMQLQAQYLDIIKGIVTGQVKDDSLALIDSIGLQQLAASAIEQSEAERQYIAQYEQDEKYNLPINSANAPKRTVFYRPAKGVITSEYSFSQHGITIATEPNESVMSILAGTVILAEYTLDWGWIVQIQHADNYISVYKNLTKILKNAGEHVKSGEVVALAGKTKNEAANRQFYFELWKDGEAVNPKEEIIF